MFYLVIGSCPVSLGFLLVGFSFLLLPLVLIPIPQDGPEYVLLSLLLLFCPDMQHLLERGKVEEIQTKFLILLQKYLNRKSVKFHKFYIIYLHMKAQGLPQHLRVQAGGQHHLPGQVQRAAPDVLENTAWRGEIRRQ